MEKLRRVNNTGFTVDALFDNDVSLKTDMAIMYKNQEIGFIKI